MRLREPSALPRDYGQAAENVWLEHGDLRPLARPRLVAALPKTGVKAIYRFGQALNSESQYWFSWTDYVHAAKVQVASDTAERTIFTGDGPPKFTTATLGTTGANLPSAALPLGLTAPVTAPLLTAVADTGTTGTVQRDYVYLFTNAYGDLGPPSPVATITCATNQHITLSGMETTLLNGAPVTGRLVYRSEAGAFLYVGEVGPTGGSFLDNVATDDLGDEILSTEFDPPPEGLRGLINLPNGIMAGFDGNNLYFCEPNRPYAWPEKYRLAFPFPVVGIQAVDQSVVVVTTGTPYVVTGTDPGGMEQRPAKLNIPGASMMSVVTSGTDVMYASDSGLCRVGVGRADNMTALLFTDKQWVQKYNPASIVATWHDGVYLATYLDGSTRRGFAFWPDAKAFVDLPDFAATAFYRDTVTNKTYCAIEDALYVFRDGASVYDMRWVSQRLLTPLTEFTWLAARSTKYPAVIDVRCNGLLRDTVTLSSPEPARIGEAADPGLTDNWEFVVRGDTQLQSLTAATNQLEALGG